MPLLKIEKKYIFFSVIVHTLLLLLIVLLSDFGTRLYLPASAIYVDILKSRKPEVKSVTKVKTDTPAKEKPVKTTKPPAKKKEIKSLKKDVPEKKKTPPEKINPEKRKKEITPERKEKKEEVKIEDVAVDDKSFERMMESIDDISREVNKKRALEQSRSVAMKREGELKGNIEDVRFKLYYDSVWYAIKESWILPDIPGVDENNLSAIIMLRVRNDGEVIAMDYEKRSGNSLFDESAMKAVKKANPLPPVPEGLSDGILEIGVRFIPE